MQGLQLGVLIGGQGHLPVGGVPGPGLGVGGGDGVAGEEVAVVDLRRRAADQVGVAYPTHQVAVAGDVGQRDQHRQYHGDAQKDLHQFLHGERMRAKVTAQGAGSVHQLHVEEVGQLQLQAVLHLLHVH